VAQAFQPVRAALFARSQAALGNAGLQKLCFEKGRMRTRYRIVEPGSCYFATSTIVEWIPLFTRKPYFDIIIESLKFCRKNKGLKIYAYVIMDNHVHLLISGEYLSNIIKDFKRHTAKELIKALKVDGKQWVLSQFKFHKLAYKKDSNYQVWQEGFHPQIIYSDEVLNQKIEYIHNNPVRAGFVEKPEDWLYSSARNYWELSYIMDIDPME